MLEDRDYMRPPAYDEPRVSLTVALVIANAAVFLAQLFSTHFFFRAAEIQDQYFALSLDGLEHGYAWQLLTFQFLHAGWLHLIFNCVAIFFFGRYVETILGARRFLTLYFSSGVIGGAVQMLFALIIPKYFSGAVIGASAGASGLIAAFAAINWLEQFTVLLFFIIPLPLRGRTLFWGSVVASLLLMLIPGFRVADAAHLGGLLTGYFFTRQIFHGGWRWPEWKFKPRELVAAVKGKNRFGNSAAGPDEELSTDEFLKNEVDPILDKISARGIGSLTVREREILESARKKMTRA